jgi:hypothetical protein
MQDAAGQYAIGQAYSRSGSGTGPWEQDPVTLNQDDGGHAMLFTDLEGQLRISYHAPNSQRETLTIRPVSIDEKGRITIHQ